LDDGTLIKMRNSLEVGIKAKQDQLTLAEAKCEFGAVARAAEPRSRRRWLAAALTDKAEYLWWRFDR
jgi:hypothetical protein